MPSGEIRELDAEIARLCAEANPTPLAAPGVGAETAATLFIAAGDNPERLKTEPSFAAFCGAAPIEASSRQITRQRQNRGGDRQANYALWGIAMVHLRCDDRAQRRTTQGKSRKEIIRCLKRYIARNIPQLLTKPPPVPHGEHLRQLRQTENITIADAAQAINTRTNRLSGLERATRRSHGLATHYHNWLTQHAT